MKLFRSVLESIISIMVIIILVIVTIWLVRGQNNGLATMPTTQPIVNPLAQMADTSPVSTPKLVQTPTEKPVPKITPTPTIIMFRAVVNTQPPSTPKPTLVPTVTPEPMGEVVNESPVLSKQQIEDLGVDPEAIFVKDWSSRDGLIVYTMANQGANIPAEISYWSISLDKGTVSKLDDYKSNQLSSEVEKKIQQYNPPVNSIVVSPDSHWVVWGEWGNFVVKNLDSQDLPIDLLTQQYEELQGGAGTVVWSPDSKRIAYVVENGNEHRYEIRNSDPTGKDIQIIHTSETQIYHLTWSPDSEFLAFIALDLPQSGINHLYVVRNNGKNLTQITTHGNAGGPLQWSPTGDSIVFENQDLQNDGLWLLKLKIH